MSDLVLEMRNITKSFPGVRALDDVTFKVKSGEVHALIGENGAGKSTLMKILSGAYRLDTGEIHIDGRKAHIANPQDAIRQGIAVIYQELNLAPNLTAIQNVLLGHEVKTRGGFIKKRENAQEAARWLDIIGKDIISDYNVPVRSLSVAQQQMIEIAKALSRKAKIIVMDEPTASLTEKEMNILFDRIRMLKENGVTIIYISHRLEELFVISDSITVLRDGRFVDCVPTKSIDRNGLITRMIGRELTNTFPPRTRCVRDEVLLEAQDVCGGILRDVSFKLHRGEILGISGLVGSGRTELMRCIFGADPVSSGSVSVKAQKRRFRHPMAAVDAGIGFATEDRKSQGLFLRLDMRNNISVANLRRISRLGFVNKKNEMAIVMRYLEELAVVPAAPKKQVGELSGGNQQKIVLAKWLATGSDIIILDEPTRGIDVGAKYEIYTLMDKLAQNGIGIIMVSSELPEVLAMSDRILVMHEGRLTAEISHEEASEALVMHHAHGRDSSEENAQAR